MLASPAGKLVSGYVESNSRLLSEEVSSDGVSLSTPAPGSSSDGVGLSTPARGHVSAGVGGLELTRRL